MTSPAPPEPQPVFGLRLRAAALASIALGAGIWLTGQWARRVEHSFPGHLQARMLTVTAEQTSRLQEVRVKPGQRVKAGECLLVLDSGLPPSERDGNSQPAPQRENVPGRLKAAADLELHWRRRELQAEIFQTQFRLAGLRQEKLHQEVEQIAWRENLSSQDVFAEPQRTPTVFRFLSESVGEVPEQRVRAMLREDAAASAALAIAAQITLCEERLEELRSLDRGLEAQIRTSHGVEAPEHAAPAEDVPTAATTTVVSPGYGLIGLTRKQAGEVVQPGEVLVQILDDDRRTIEVEIPSRMVVRFTPGQRVRLEFPGPEQRIGIVSSIAPQTSAPGIARQNLDDDAPVKLAIEPAGKLWPSVPIGSRVLVFQP